MAKKKTAQKKAAKTRVPERAAKKGKKKAPHSAETPACSDEQLNTAAVITWGAEGVLGLVEYCSCDLGAGSIEFPVILQTVTAGVDTGGRVASRDYVVWGRSMLQKHDFADMPHARVVGRVLYILLNHRRFGSCSGGDVFRVFLVEIPSQLKRDHRQEHRRPGQDVDVTEPGGRKAITSRMKRLREFEVVAPTVRGLNGREEDFVLTQLGNDIFEDWPSLSEITGLELDGPVTPESSSRRRPRRRS